MSRILLLLVLAAAAAVSAVAFDASLGIDTLLAQAAMADPLARNDTFTLLKARHKRFLSQSNPDLSSKLNALESLEITTPVTVRLVGFTIDQRRKLEIQLSRYLDLLNKNEAFHVIGGTPNRQLSTKSRIHVEVTGASNTLANSVHSAIQKHIDSSSSSVYLQPVPYASVDELIQSDLEKPLRSYFIYILHPGRQARSYGYDYRTGGATIGNTSGSYGDFFTKCLGNSWTGSRDRYLWLDLSAGPVEYGPALSGDGLVIREEAYPASSAAMSDDSKGIFLADLASLVWSASQMLLAPALRIPVYHEPTTDVHLYHIRGERDTADKSDVDWDAIQASLSSEDLLLKGSKLEFKRYTIQLEDCAICSAILAQSTRTYTSRVLLDRYSLFVNEYIDSKLLHHLLIDSREELEQLAGVPISQEYSRVVPVYVFDIDTDRTLLLDRNHQAMAFRDMVIAMRTGHPSLTEFNCNNRPVVMQSRDVERPVVASLLQTLWGISPTHLTWSSQHNSTLVDYTWSLGQTPFGPFSNLMSLSFVQRDAARRNVLLTTLNTTIWGANYALEASNKIKGAGLQAEAAERWNLFVYKLNKATSAISQFDYDTALYFIRSSEHDIYALHRIVYDASTKLEAVISCFQAPPFPWLTLAFAVVSVALVFVAVTATRSRRRQRF